MYFGNILCLTMYQKIALAIAFSPRMEALIAETKKLVDIFHSELILIHVGEKTQDLDQKLSKVLEKRGLPLNTKVLWKSGKPTRSILGTCEEGKVDLLVMGALKKEGFLTYYIGSVARKVIRKASCSVLTLIDPKESTTIFSKIVINGTQLSYTPFVLSQGLAFSKIVNASIVNILNEIKMYGLQMSAASEDSEKEASLVKRQLVKDEMQYVEDILEKIETGDLKINIKVTGGKWAIELAKFSERIEADLLIVGDENRLNFFDRIFPHDLEDLLSTLPCNLLIVKPQ